MIIPAFNRAENIWGKGRKCWLPALSPFPSMFSKFLFWVESCSNAGLCGIGFMMFQS